MLSFKNHSKRLLTLCKTISLVFVLVLCAMTSFAQAQNQSKIIEKGNLFSAETDPLKLVDIQVSNQSVKLNEKFEAGDNWLKGSNFKLKNISDKEIIHITFAFDFPETLSTGNMMRYTINLGNRPGSANKRDRSLNLAAGEELEVIVNEEEYRKLSRFIETRQPMMSINKMKFFIDFVVFADSTGYMMGGTFYRQDPNNPNRWTPQP